jgi:hypothetical protein
VLGIQADLHICKRTRDLACSYCCETGKLKTLNMSSLSAQIAAAHGYLRLLTEAEECSRLYLEAGIEMPELLKNIVGNEDRTAKPSSLNGNVTKKSPASPGVPIPYRP